MSRPLRNGLLSLLLPLCLWFTAAGASADADAPFLWQVHGPKATHYLLGSVHLLPDEGQDLPSGIQEAYDAVEGVVFETDIAAIRQSGTREALDATARAPQGLKAEIGDKMYAQLALYASRIHMPLSGCAPYHAWYCAMILELFSFQKAGFTSDNGIDVKIYGWAREDEKSVRWFEQPDSHMDLFTGMSTTLSRDFLASALDEQGGDSGDNPGELLRAWKDNDVGAFEKLDAQLKSAYPAVYDRLLAGRNRNWIPLLKRLLDGGESQLIVVGAAHMVGPDGLVAQLRARGYKVLPYIAIQSQLVTTRKPVLVQAALRR